MSGKKIGVMPAATIILVRDGQNGLEVFMVQRNRRIDFAAGALVFPGGRVDDEDTMPSIIRRCRGQEQSREPEIGYHVAAIREAYEECGILLACNRNDPKIISADRLAELEGHRRALCANEIKFSEILESEDLFLACDRLIPFAHWITPEIMPKRFDTWFFIAEAPAGHAGRHDGRESVDSLWITPADVLAEAAAGRFTVIFPTRMNIAKISRFRHLEDARRYCAEHSLVRVQPWVEQRENGPVLCIPAEADYGLTEECMTKLGFQG